MAARGLLIPMPPNPQKTAFLFPGQGSQAIGMGYPLANEIPEALEVFSQADELLGYSLSRLCWEGPENELNETVHTQPALLTHSIAVLKAFQERYPDFQPACTAGHSLGQFSALVAAGAIDFAEALRLVQARGKAMQEAGLLQPGGMTAVLGLDVEQVERVCNAVSDESGAGVWVANDNCPGQVVISGEKAALSEAEQRLLLEGARKIVRLAVSIASHSPLMKSAKEKFNRTLQATALEDPSIAIVGNVSATTLRTAEAIREDLAAQLTARVRWTESMHAMLKAGVTTFVELGSNNVLTKLLRRIERSATGIHMDAPTSFTAFDEAT